MAESRLDEQEARLRGAEPRQEDGRQGRRGVETGTVRDDPDEPRSGLTEGITLGIGGARGNLDSLPRKDERG